MSTEYSPLDPKHPFWSSTIGSTLQLTLKKSPDSQINSLTVVVYTVTEPYVYKTIVSQKNVDSPICVYHNKKDTIKIIKNEWWIFYGDRTNVEFIEHLNFDLSKNTDFNYIESCPSSPNPNTLRKTSLKMRIEKSMSKRISRKGSYHSSGDSSQDNSPRDKMFYRKGYYTRSGDSSQENSPRDFTSPRKSMSPRTPRLLKIVSTKLSKFERKKSREH